MRQFNGTAAVLAAIVLIVALAPILYVASIGPVAWMGGREMISTDEDSVVMVIYAPLQYAADHSTTADMALTWYVSLFVPVVTSQPAVYDPVASPAAGVYYDPVPQGAGVPAQRPTIPSPN